MVVDSTKPRILQVGMKYYAPRYGGIEDFVQILAEGLQDEFNTQVITYGESPRTRQDEWNGVPVTRVGSFGELFSLPLAPSFPYWFSKQRVHLIHLHVPNPYAQLSSLILHSRVPTVVTYHSDVVKQRAALWMYNYLVRASLGRANRITVHTRRYAESSPAVRPWLDKCEFIPHGVDLAAFANDPAIAMATEELHKEYPGPLVVFVGRLVYYKGVSYLIKAMKHTRATLLIVGDGPLRADLEQQTVLAGLMGKVAFLGSVAHARKVACLRAANVFVLPSTHRSEAFGMVQVEAMACGKPVISTEIGTGVSHVNQNGVTGIVVPPADSDAIAGALRRVLDDPKLGASMGEAGRARVEAEFTQERMVQRMRQLYRDVLNGVVRATA